MHKNLVSLTDLVANLNQNRGAQLKAIDAANAAIDARNERNTDVGVEAVAATLDHQLPAHMVTIQAVALHNLRAEASHVARLEAACDDLRNKLAEMTRHRDILIGDLDAMRARGPQKVATDAFGIRFHGPQGSGTGDRLKAVGGRFAFTSKKGEPIRGYWVLPTTDAARNLSLELSTEGKQVEPFEL